MKRKNFVIVFSSAVLIMIAAFCGWKEIQWANPQLLSAVIVSDGNEEEISTWKHSWQGSFLFLPAYADLSQVQIRSHTDYPVYINGRLLTDATVCSDFSMNESLELVYDSFFGSRYDTLTIVQSANVPTMYIDVKSGQMDYIHSEKGNKESGVLRLYSADGQLENAVAVESLQGRGNATWDRDKKAYSLRLDSEADFLDMGNAQRWVLLANGYDFSHLRNKIAFDLARNAGIPYVPDCQWVDLYLNGEYAGLYLLSERNEIHPNRVNIPSESSFLVSWEGEWRLKTQGYPHVVTKDGVAIRIHQSAFAPEKIQMMWESVINAIYAEDGIDPITGKSWQALIDLDTWAMRFLIDEITADYDGGGISQFFYYNGNDGTGKIYAGSIWDKDITFNSGHWQISAPNAIIVSQAKDEGGEELSIFPTLFHKEEFYTRVVELYQTVFLPLLTELCDTGIEEYANQISQAAWMNGKRWNFEDTTEEYLVIRDFLEKRMAFLDAYWIQKEEFYHVKFYEDVYGEFAVRPGEYLPYIPQYEGYGWFVYGTDTLFDVSQPIYESADVILQKLDEESESADIKMEIITMMVIAVSLLVLGVADIWQNRKIVEEYDRNK